jgi:hypothetical protein
VALQAIDWLLPATARARGDAATRARVLMQNASDRDRTRMRAHGRTRTLEARRSDA